MTLRTSDGGQSDLQGDPMTDKPRTTTVIDVIAESWLDEYLELVPEERVYLGRAGREAEYSDYSPAGAEAVILEAKKALARISKAVPADEVDRVTKLDLTRSL